MEPLNNTHDQRVQNLKRATHVWVGSARDNGIIDLNDDFRIVGVWGDKHAEPVTETDDVACLLSAVLSWLRNPGINLDSWIIYGETHNTPDMLVIDVEGVVLGIHVEEDTDNSHSPYTLHVRVLDHLPAVKVSCGLGTGEVSISVDDHMHMWWTWNTPTLGEVREALRNLLTFAHRFRGSLRVENMRRIDSAFSTQGAVSVPAHNYRDLVDWLTPMVGYDMGGEHWDREKFLALTSREDPENYCTEHTWALTHPDISGELELRITNFEKRREMFPVTMTVSDKHGHRSIINAPTHADIAGTIAKWALVNIKEGSKK